MTSQVAVPVVADRATFQAQLDALRIREKAHTKEGDAIAAARRRLPMVEVDATTRLIGEHGEVTLLDAFEQRRMLIAYYFMWYTSRPAPEQCEGCTWFTSQVRELSYIHSREVTYATFCQGPYEESARYRDFMGWEMPMWEDSPPGWPQRTQGKQNMRIDGRPTAQWGRLKAGHSDELGGGAT